MDDISVHWYVSILVAEAGLEPAISAYETSLDTNRAARLVFVVTEGLEPPTGSYPIRLMRPTLHLRHNICGMGMESNHRHKDFLFLCSTCWATTPFKELFLFCVGVSPPSHFLTPVVCFTNVRTLFQSTKHFVKYFFLYSERESNPHGRMPTGFSYHYSFHYQPICCLWSGLYLNRICSDLGSPCLVSTPSSFLRLGSVFPSQRVHRIYGVLLREFPLWHSYFYLGSYPYMNDN